MAVAATLPKSFDRTAFSGPEFDVDSFITASRLASPSLEALKAELQNHLKELKNELVELINVDYADFINLSTNLVGLDRTLEEIRAPLVLLRQDIEKTKRAVHVVVDRLEDKLQKRVIMREKKIVLQLFLNISDAIQKTEQLLSAEEAAGTATSSTALVERVAGVFNQLHYYVSQAKGQPFLLTVDDRITRITNALRKRLEGDLVDGIQANAVDQITPSLRTYALIDQRQEAEQLYRRLVVSPYLSKVISAENLEAKKLSGVYADVLSFVRTDRASILAITRSMLRGAGYDFLSHAIWPEVVALLFRNLKGIFLAGSPDVFHRNYTASMQFVADFEQLAWSQRHVAHLRAQPSMVEFMAKWTTQQLPIYYQIRFKEIATALEDVLARPQPSDLTGVTNLYGTVAVLTSIRRCWAPDVFLYGIAHRFVKLTLQLVARYESWVSALIPGEAALAGSSAALDLCALLLVDVQLVCSSVQSLCASSFAPQLPPAFVESEQGQQLLASLDGRLAPLVPRLARALADQMLAPALAAVQQVKSISGQYRMTNREAPSAPSAYVAAMFAPAVAFLAAGGKRVPPSVMVQITDEVAATVALQYGQLIAELLVTVKRTEDSLQKLLRTKKKANPSAVARTADGLSDEDKIRLQLLLDQEQFEVELRRLGVADVDSVKGIEELRALVEPGIAIRSQDRTAPAHDASPAGTPAETPLLEAAQQQVPVHDEDAADAQAVM